MSRGLGRWERLLLHELNNNPRVGYDGRRFIMPRDYASTPSELSALHRAACSLHRKGLAKRLTSPVGVLAHIEDVSVEIGNAPHISTLTEIEAMTLGAVSRRKC
jgi:hypothetical protein